VQGESSDDRSEISSLQNDAPLQDERIEENPSIHEQRSEDDQATRYNLRNNPSRTSNTSFNSKYSTDIFLQYAQNISDSVSNIVDCVTDAWSESEELISLKSNDLERNVLASSQKS